MTLMQAKVNITAMNEASRIIMRPIGIVHNELRRGITPPRQKSPRSVIEVMPSYAEGLQGIEPGQALVIVFLFHLSQKPVPLLQHPQGDTSRPRRGVFALRSPLRPNPIGLTTVRVLDVKENKLIVAGLDAFDGTPVLDIKPYIAWVDEPPAPEQAAASAT